MKKKNKTIGSAFAKTDNQTPGSMHSVQKAAEINPRASDYVAQPMKPGKAQSSGEGDEKATETNLADLPLPSLSTVAERDQILEAIKRLRASKNEFEKRQWRNGREAGLKFFIEQAHYCHGARLMRRYHDSSSYTHLGFLALARIMTNTDGTEHKLEESLRKRYGDDIDEPAWLLEFAWGMAGSFGLLDELGLWSERGADPAFIAEAVEELTEGDENPGKTRN
jgi:hypothetical protein